MKKLINKKEAEEILRKSLFALGLSEDMKTNPLIMKEVIKEIKLDDFESSIAQINNFLQEICSSSISFKPLIKDIKSGIIEKHPAILEFLSFALQKKWLDKSKHIIKSAHITFILEFLTSAMCNNSRLFDEIHTHIVNKEKKYGIDSKHTMKTIFRYLSLTDDYFEIIKTMSIDPIMIIFRPDFIDFKLEHKKLKHLLKNEEICFLEYKILNHHKGILGLNELLKINIFEAGVTEYRRGFKSNSISAFALSEFVDTKKIVPKIKTKKVFPENSKNPIYNLLANKNNKIIEMPISQKWMSLYEAWNLTFMLSEIENLDLLLPKLLIPSVINAKPKNYLQARVISLWISINNVILRKCSDISEVQGPSKREEIAKVWGEINKKYAFNLAKEEMHEDSILLKKHYSKFFSHPFWNFFKLIGRFVG